MAEASKIDFLRHVIVHSATSMDSPALMTFDGYVRDNIRIAAEAMQLRLIRLVRDPEGLGYRICITPAGRCLAAGDLNGAAVAIESGSVPARISGLEPVGPIGSRLTPGDPPISLQAGMVRTNAPEVLRGIATGHLRVEGGSLRACEPGNVRISLHPGGVGTASLRARNLSDAHRYVRG